MSPIDILISAYTSKDYSKLTTANLFELVSDKIIRPETAIKLLEVVSRDSSK